MRQSDGGYFEGGGYVAGCRGGNWPDGCRRFFPSPLFSTQSLVGYRDGFCCSVAGTTIVRRGRPHSEVPLGCHVISMLGEMMTMSDYADVFKLQSMDIAILGLTGLKQASFI
ncbi:hypothetical protein L484_003639 [Morus notabilis]|uniref:Uncharacterized protein n=1 Tax=Morus notabilis TaxID=981085 RepID=W9S3Z2_9ROSA|nr:hypothetical protein L484_003639 [Morus notabilis]